MNIRAIITLIAVLCLSANQTRAQISSAKQAKTAVTPNTGWCTGISRNRKLFPVLKIASDFDTYRELEPEAAKVLAESKLNELARKTNSPTSVLQAMQLALQNCNGAYKGPLPYFDNNGQIRLRSDTDK